MSLSLLSASQVVFPVVRNPLANAGNTETQLGSQGQELKLGYPEGGNGNSLQYFCLENSMDGGA